MKDINKFLASFSATCSDAALAAGKEFLVNKQNVFANVANFCGIDEKGETSEYTCMPCHSSIQYNLKRHAVATENGWHRNTLRTEEMDESIIEPFLRWFLYNSIYSPLIVNRDDFEFCRDFGFIVAGNAPHKLFQNCMIISRHFYEAKPQAFVKFGELTAAGYDPFICYQVCFNTMWSDKASNRGESSLVTNKGGHRVSWLFSKASFLNYFKGDAKRHFGPAYTEEPSIYGGSSLFVDTDTQYKGHLPRENDEEVARLIRASRGEKEEEPKAYRPPNPFAPKKKSLAYFSEEEKFGLTYKELFEVYVPYLCNLFKEYTNDEQAVVNAA